MSENTPASERASLKLSFSRFDRMASVFAVALSIAALLVSLVEVATVRAQQRATAWPYIQISTSYSDDGFRLELKNKGVGPALMSDVMLTSDGQPVENLDQFIADTVGETDAFSYDVYSTSNPSNGVVAAGETVTLFSVPWEPRTRKFVTALNGVLDVETCYCSIHRECWSTKLSADGTSPTNSCRTGITS